jgi:DNA polymerase-3 subunit epsilon
MPYWGVMSDRWIAVDVETAADRDSICAVGIVEWVDGELRKIGRWLLRPPRGEWNPFNISTHGIRPHDVVGKPTLAQWWPEFLAIVDTAPVIAHHAAFDMNAFRYTLAASNIDVEVFRFACSRVIARDTWPGWWSYSLPIVVDELHLPNFEHHDPLDDAMACARIVQLAIVHRKTNSLEDLIAARHFKWGRVDESLYQPFSGSGSVQLTCPQPSPGVVFDPLHPLFGRIVVFTGALDSMTRSRAAQLVVNVGGQFANSVTKKTHYLVCGYQDFRKLAGGTNNSRKREKAQSLINEGADLELLPENEFLELVYSGG